MTKYDNLTDREQMLMKCIWELGDGTRLAYMVELANQKFNLNWKPQTASTFLNKLVLKGFVEPYREGQYVHYRISIAKEDYSRQMIRQNVEFWNDGDAVGYAAALCRACDIKKEDLQKLQDSLGELDAHID